MDLALIRTYIAALDEMAQGDSPAASWARSTQFTMLDSDESIEEILATIERGVGLCAEEQVLRWKVRQKMAKKML